MQLLCEADSLDPGQWADDAETRAQAGLTQLQIWHEADAPARSLILFEVADRKRAEAWLARSSGFGRTFNARFLHTA